MNRFLSALSKTAKIAEKVAVEAAPVAASILIQAPERQADLPTESFDLLEGALHMSTMGQVTSPWMQYAGRALSALPYIIAGIQHIKSDSIAGTEKKTLALEALGLSYGVAQITDPAHAPAIEAATEMAGATIDGLVKLMHASGEAPAK